MINLDLDVLVIGFKGALELEVLMRANLLACVQPISGMLPCLNRWRLSLLIRATAKHGLSVAA